MVQATVGNLVRDSLEQVIEPIIYDEALGAHPGAPRSRAQGLHHLGLTGRDRRTLAAYLGADDAIATKARVDEQGRYTGDVEFYSYGPFKAEAMRRIAERDGIDLSAS